MLLTLSTTHRPATDLGYLLRKNPARAQSFELSFGKAHVFYPEATLPLHQLLSHLYVLIPVLDNDKHYWVGDDEVAKLLRHGEGWLATHPERDAITRRYSVRFLPVGPEDAAVGAPTQMGVVERLS